MRSKNLVRTVVAALVLTLVACATAADSVKTGQAEFTNDPFVLLEARVSGDSLVATVQYSGGSAEHEFALEGIGVATKSLPRQQMLAVRHDAHGDLARALITEERRFPLANWQDPRNTVVHIRLEGWEEMLVYRYER